MTLSGEIERECRSCGGPLAATQPAHHFVCRSCYFGDRRQAPRKARLEQLSIFDLLGTGTEIEEESTYLRYEAERERMRRAA